MVKDLDQRRINVLLTRLYTNPNSAVVYAGAGALLREANKTIKVSRRQVEDFLSTQRAYTLHRRVVRRFRRLPTLAPGLHTHWQADLCDMQRLARSNYNKAYILVCVDTLSRQIFAEPIRAKNADEMIRAFEAIFKRSKYTPWRILTDAGKEFIATKVRDFLRSKGVEHNCLYTSPQFHAGMVERANRTIKERLFRYLTAKNSVRWVTILPSIISALNHSVNRSIGMRPCDVTFANSDGLRERLEHGGSKTIKKIVKFKVGDIVRIAKTKKVFVKGYMPNFSNELFVVTNVRETLAPITYKLAAFDDKKPQKGWFYAEELCRVGGVEHPLTTTKTI